MKKKLCLTLSIGLLLTVNVNAWADLQSQIKLKSPYCVSDKANKNSSDETSSFGNSMLIDSSLGTMKNMINGINGTTSNALNMREMEKQQLDYAKQQAAYEAQMLKEDSE